VRRCNFVQMAKAADVPHVATMLAMMRDADAHPSHSSSNKSASDNGTPYSHLDSGLRHTSSQVCVFLGGRGAVSTAGRPGGGDYQPTMQTYLPGMQAPVWVGSQLHRRGTLRHVRALCP
jgi:hypothetical protein